LEAASAGDIRLGRAADFIVKDCGIG